MNKMILTAAVLFLSMGVATATAAGKKRDKKKDKKEVPMAVLTLPSKAMKTTADSVSYAMGVAQSNGLKNYVIQNLKVDTAYYAEFIRGLREGVLDKTPKEQAYMAGQQIASQVTEQIFPTVNSNIYKDGDSLHTLDKILFLEGFISAAGGEDSLRIPGGLQARMEYLNINGPKLKSAYTLEKYGANKKAGEDFLAANKTKDSIQTTASGLQYKVLKMGTGEKPKATDKVKVNYRGTLIDGTEFDSSYKRKEALSFYANRVIKGWTEALTMMPVGSKWMLYIPQELAYGDRETGTIPPYSTLIFEVELIGIEKAPAATNPITVTDVNSKK